MCVKLCQESFNDIESCGGDNIDYNGHFNTSMTFSSWDNAISWEKSIVLIFGFKYIILAHKNNGCARFLRCNCGE